MFSWLNPIRLKRNKGKQKIIKPLIFKVRLVKIKLSKQKTKTYQIMFTIAVE